MSEEPTVVEQPTSKPEGGQEPKVDVDEVMARMERLESSNQRLLDESKSWKAKYQGVQSKVEEAQTEQMQQKNDFKGLYEKTLEKVGSLEEEVRSQQKSGLEKTLQYEVAKVAKDAEDTDLLLAAVKLKKKDLLGYDRESGTWKGVGDAVDELRVSNPGLFVKDKPGMINGRPQSAVPKDKTVDELINDDPNSVLASALEELLK